MIEDQAIPASIPFLRTNEEQAVKMRKRLEDIFSNISLVHDVIVPLWSNARRARFANRQSG